MFTVDVKQQYNNALHAARHSSTSTCFNQRLEVQIYNNLNRCRKHSSMEMSVLENNSKHRSETTSTEFRQIEFHRRYICFHSVDLSTSYKEVYANKVGDT